MVRAGICLDSERVAASHDTVFASYSCKQEAHDETAENSI